MDSKKKNLILSIVLIVLSFVLYLESGSVVKLLTQNSFLQNFLCESVFAAFAVISLVILKKPYVLRFQTAGFRDGLVAGVPLFVMNGILLLTLVAGLSAVTVPASSVVLFILQMLLIGVAEETLFRGILQNAVMDCIGSYTVGRVRASIIISGVIFGLVHLTNALSPAITLAAAARQAIVVIPLGIVFGAIYYISKRNLWVVILIHACNDFCAFVSSGMLDNVSQTEVIGTGHNAVGLSLLVFGMIAVWLLRKKRLEKVK